MSISNRANYGARDRKFTAAAKPTEDIVGRLEKMKRLASALAQIAQGEYVDIELLKRRVFPSELENDLSFREKVERFEIALIIEALSKTGGRQNHAARMLGLNVTTLNMKIKRYNISFGMQAMFPAGR